MNIAVLMGGISPERNVSLSSGKAVAQALSQRGHNVVALDPARGASCLINLDELVIPTTPPSTEELSQFTQHDYLLAVSSSHFDNIDIAFSVLHGKYGEDGLLQALLEARGIPYTGSKIASSALAMDKMRSKIMFTAVGVPTPAWTNIREHNKDDHESMQEIRDEFRGNLVVKPNDQGSTVGMTIIQNGNLDEISSAIQYALQFSDVALAEKYIAGRELTVAVIGDEALPIIEIAPDGGFYDYEHKYTKGMSQYICPADIDEELTSFIQNLSITAHKVLGCTGYSRIDFRLDEDNQPWCLEVNTLPGMTATSLVPKAAAAAGIEFGELCEKIIELSN